LSLRLLVSGISAAVALVAVALLVWIGGASGSASVEQQYAAAPAATPTAAVPATPLATPTPTVVVPPPASAPQGPVSGPTIAEKWLVRTATKAGIPEVALRAYARAQLMVPKTCKVGWTSLAGLGWVESQHGTIGGRTLGADGRSSAPILGPALNGQGFGALPATPQSTALDGDPTWQHAVGPMQFIASTWARWASDGDGDGVADPQDIYDAAYSAARYLCAGGYNLTTGSGWARAIFSYNHTQQYVDQVWAAAMAYAKRTG
jgi:hypothetical protein